MCFANQIDEEIHQDKVLKEVWTKLEEELLTLCNPDKYPERLINNLINHGPEHWTFVYSKASQLWLEVCRKKKKYSTSLNAFLLKASCWLHDIAMIIGDETTLALPEIYLQLFKKYDLKDKSGAFNREKAITPLGLYYIRKHQGSIAADIVRNWTTTTNRFKPIVDNYPDLLERLIFIIENYAILHKLNEEKLREKFGDTLGEIMTISGILQFADWSHLNYTRSNSELISRIYKHNNDLFSSKILDQDSRVSDNIFLLPKLYRNYFIRNISLDTSCDPVRFSVTIEIPKELKNSEQKQIALKQLINEWREKIYPSRMLNPLATDYILKYGNVDIFYKEPAINIKEEIENDFERIPNNVLEYWIASQYFNLNDESQFNEKSMNSRNIKTSAAISYSRDDLYFKLDRDFYTLSTKPMLDRQVFAYISMIFTRGNLNVAERFYHRFRDTISCDHSFEKTDPISYIIDYTWGNLKKASKNYLKYGKKYSFSEDEDDELLCLGVALNRYGLEIKKSQLNKVASICSVNIEKLYIVLNHCKENKMISIEGSVIKFICEDNAITHLWIIGSEALMQNIKLSNLK